LTSCENSFSRFDDDTILVAAIILFLLCMENFLFAVS